MTRIIDWPSQPITVTDATFKDIVQKYPFVVVDCWAPWCGPCVMVAPIIEELSRDYKGKIAFGKLDSDDNPHTMEKYGIMSIPTLLIFKSGKLVDQSVGALPRDQLESELLKHL
jgi:thioredoxin 1